MKCTFLEQWQKNVSSFDFTQWIDLHKNLFANVHETKPQKSKAREFLRREFA